jgi:metal-responsive CopG/Arc/MetJ family transcriptional regulator
MSWIIRLPPELVREVDSRRIGEENRTQTARRILREGLKVVKKVEEG